MSKIRFSLGRSISPMPRAKIAAARDPRLPPSQIFEYADASELNLRARNGIQLFYTRLESAPIYDQPLNNLDLHEITDAQAHLPRPDFSVQEEASLSFPGLEGSQFLHFREIQFELPPPLLRSYRLFEDDEGRAIVEPPTSIEMLRPLLSHPLRFEDGGLSPLLEPLREDQREAVEMLHKREVLLLADDLGLGRRMAASVALGGLFQQGRAQKALIVCPEWARRSWVGHLTRWAPGLYITVIRGDRMLREYDWRTPAHIYLIDYRSLSKDTVSGVLDGSSLLYDVLILDDAHLSRFQTLDIASALKLFRAERRWALASSLPREVESWLFLFAFLTPERIEGASELSLADVQGRFMPYVLRRTMEELADELPSQLRHEIWIDLDYPQAEFYQEVLAEEQKRLAELEDSAKREAIIQSVDRLKQACNFGPQLLASAKTRALVDLVEDVSASDAKIIVFSQFKSELDQLQPALEAYGVLRLDIDSSEDQCSEILDAFSEEDLWHVLLMQIGTKTRGKSFPEPIYIVHFDHSWNPAVRRQAEQEIRPSEAPRMPITVCEYWVAGTMDAHIHALLSSRGLLPHQIPDDTLPEELEEQLTTEDWLEKIFEDTPSVAHEPLEVSEALEETPLEVLEVEEIEFLEEPIEEIAPTEEEEIVERPKMDVPPIVELEPPEEPLIEIPPTEEPEPPEEPTMGTPTPEETEPPEGLMVAIQPPEEEEIPEELTKEAPPFEEPQPPTEPDFEVPPSAERESWDVELSDIYPDIEQDQLLDQEAEVPEIAESEPPEESKPAVTGLLPGDALKDAHWARLRPEELLEEVKLLMRALGYPEAEILGEPEESGGDLLAWREKRGSIKQVLVRCIKSKKNISITQARALVKATDERGDCMGAYLVTTSDFTPACRKFAAESEGQLDLVSGSEFYRHLHIMGRG